MAFDPNHDSWTPIYIDGVRRMCTGPSLRFFVDSNDLPCRRCSQHSLDHAAVAYLNAGGAVRTSGQRYSLHPDRPVP